MKAEHMIMIFNIDNFLINFAYRIRMDLFATMIIVSTYRMVAEWIFLQQ